MPASPGAVAGPSLGRAGLAAGYERIGGCRFDDDTSRSAQPLPLDGPNDAQMIATAVAPFDRAAAAEALGAVTLSECEKSDGPTGPGHIKVTFSPSGTVTSAVVDQSPFAGTAVGGCVAGKFRSAHIPAFGGGPVAVGKSFLVK